MRLQPGYWVLVLNDMRSSQIETCQPVACAETREELDQFMESHKADESYSDGKWGKTFKKDSPLEWFNPPTEYFRQGILQWFPEEAPEIPHYREV